MTTKIDAAPFTCSRLVRPLLLVFFVLLLGVQVHVLRLPLASLVPAWNNATVTNKNEHPNTAGYEALKEEVRRLQLELELQEVQRLQGELELRQDRQENKTNLLESVSEEQQQRAESPKSCLAVMQRMNDWNDCWRRHVSMIQNKPLKNNTNFLEPISCPIYQENEATRAETIGAPLYQFAYYAGQGFGRVVEHSTQACAIAFLLKRPCLINVSPRDPYHTWRSFIQPTTYRWDPDILHNIPSYAKQLERLARKLPIMGDSKWGATLNISQYSRGPVSLLKDSEGSEQPLVFPMQQKFDMADWKSFKLFYSGENPDRGPQTLFSPNWANAWFQRVPFDDIYRDQYNCDSRELESMIQAALYGPTDLTRQLHQERYQKAVTMFWNSTLTGVSKSTSAQRIQPHLPDAPRKTADDNGNETPSYGSIHLRTVLLKQGRLQGSQITAESIATMLRVCLSRAQALSQSDEFPQNWWFLADNATTAANVIDNIQSQQSRESEQSLPELKFFNPYDMNVAKKSSELLPSKHSNSKESTGLYGHQYIAGSIEDWVALHESKISIVAPNSAYGITGARGKRKIATEFCGDNRRAKVKYVQSFELYMESSAQPL